MLGVVLALMLVPSVTLAGANTDAEPEREYEQYSCYATFFNFRDGHGPELMRFAPEQIYDLDDLHYRHGEDLNGDVLSVARGLAPGSSFSITSDLKYPSIGSS